MADTPLTTSLIALATTYRDDIIRTMNRKSVALQVLTVKQGKGPNCAWVVEEDAAVGENYAEGADAANFGSDAQTGATLSWGLYRSNFRVTDLARSAAVGADSPKGNVDLWARTIINAAGKLASTLNVALYDGAGTGTTWAGLGVAIGDTTNTYAGIDRSADSWWQPTVVDPGSSTSVTLALIRSDLRAIYEAGGERPDLGFCSPTIFNSIGNLFDANRRYVDQIRTARGQITLDATARAINVEGCNFVEDKDCTASTIYYVNTDYVEIRYLPKKAVPASVAARVPGNDGMGPVPLGFDYQLLAKAGASDKGTVDSQAQLVVTNPKKCGCRKNAA